MHASEKSPDKMTEAERSNEICAILAQGLIRAISQPQQQQQVEKKRRGRPAGAKPKA